MSAVFCLMRKNGGEKRTERKTKTKARRTSAFLLLHRRWERATETSSGSREFEGGARPPRAASSRGTRASRRDVARARPPHARDSRRARRERPRRAGALARRARLPARGVKATASARLDTITSATHHPEPPPPGSSPRTPARTPSPARPVRTRRPSRPDPGPGTRDRERARFAPSLMGRPKFG